MEHDVREMSFAQLADDLEPRVKPGPALSQPGSLLVADRRPDLLPLPPALDFFRRAPPSRRIYGGSAVARLVGDDLSSMPSSFTQLWKARM